MPLNINYFGVVTSGSNIIAYGDNGAYLMTTDKGNTWKQYSLHPFGEIRAMVNYNDTLWGVIAEGLIIQSTDNGLIWSKKVFSLDSNDRLITLVVSDNSIYIRSIYKIFRFDKQLNFINVNSDSILKIWAYSELKPIYYDYYYIHFLNGKLFASLFGFDGFAILSEDLQQIEKIYLKDKFYHINPAAYYLRNIFTYKNKQLFHIYTGLYYPEDNYQKWTYFFSDTNFLKANDPLWYKKAVGYILNSYYFLNDELYVNYNETNPSKPNFKNLRIRKYFSEPNDTFINFNNLFENNYYTIYINDDKAYLDGITVPLYFAKQCILEDSIIVKAAGNKSLLQTQDNGKSWKLISYLTGKPNSILNDSTYIFLNDENIVNEVCYTTDNGNTSLPTILDDSLINFFPFSYTTLLYIDKDGKGFIDGTHLWSTMDYGKSWQFALQDGFFRGFPSNVVKINNKYLFSKNDPSLQGNNKLINFLYILDSSFKNLNYRKFDSTYNINYIIADDLSHFYYFATVQDEENPIYFRFEIRETNDTGKTFTTIKELKNTVHFTMGQVYEHNRDSIFFINASTNQLYLWDSKNNDIYLLWEGFSSSVINLMYLGNKFYILSKDLFLENTDRNDLTLWQSAEWDYGTPSFESVIFNGNVALAKLQDSLRPLNYYRIMPNKITDVENEDEAEVKYYTKHFYASQPYPVPARTIVKSKISYDMSFDLLESINGIYNIYGEKLEGRENITLKNKAKATAELVWDCSSAPDGIYFILIRQNGNTESIPVVVNR